MPHTPVVGRWTVSSPRVGKENCPGTDGCSNEAESSQRPACFPSLQSALVLEFARCSGCRRGTLSYSTARPDYACGASSADLEFQADRPQRGRADGGRSGLGRHCDDRRDAAQQPDTLDLIELCRACSIPVAVGGPDV